jgi:hypothetical protein
LQLTPKDIELARRYLICRSAIKSLTHDKAKIDDQYGLRNAYLKFIESALVRANVELRELNKNIL